MKALKKYKVNKLPPLSDVQLKEIDELIEIEDKEIDLSDIPELTSQQIEKGHFAYVDSLKMDKIGIHIMIDKDNLDWLKSMGKGYQPRLNKILRWARLNNCPIDQL